jgi:hypothetical protein
VIGVGAVATAAAAVHLLAAGWPPDRLERVGPVGEALLFPAADVVAWSLLLLSLALAIGRALPQGAAERLRALLLRPSPALFSLLVFAWVALAGSLVAQLVLGGLPADVDDIARLQQARTFLEGRLFLESPPEPKAFGVYGLLVRDGRWFSKYEPAPALLYALSWKMLGSPTAVNPLLGGALAAVLYALARRAGGETTARVAALLVCLSPFVLGMSASLLSHPLAALALLAACCFVSREDRSPGPGWLAAAGAALGVAGAARPWTALVVGLAVGSWAVFRKGPRAAPQRMLCLALGAAPLVALVLAYNRALTGDPLLSPFQAYDPREVPWFGYMGHSLAQGLAHTAQLGAVLNLHLFAWPASLLFVPLAALRPRLALDLLAAAAILALVAGQIFYYWIDFRFGPRYWYEAAPFLAWLTARGLGALDGCLARLHLPASRHRAALATVALYTAFGACFYLGPVLRLYGNQYGGLALFPAEAVREAWPNKDALVFVPRWRKVENDGFSSALLANPLDLAGLARLDQAAEALGPGAGLEQLAARARVTAGEASRLRREGRVLFARNLGPASRARVAAAFPGRMACVLERDATGGGVTIRSLHASGAPGRVLLRAPGGAAPRPPR